MNPKRTELLYGAFFLGVVTLIALLFGLYPTVEIPPDAAARTVGKIIGALSGLGALIAVARAFTTR